MPVARFRLENAKTWRVIVEAVEAIIEEAALKFFPEGVKLRALDPSKTVMIEVFMPQESFSEFECSEDVEVGINFHDTLTIMKRARSGDSLELLIPEGEAMVEYKMIGASTRVFRLRTITGLEIEKREFKIPFDGRAKILSKELENIIKDILQVGENVDIHLDEEKIVFSTKSESSEFEAQLVRGEPALLELEAQAPVDSRYNATYIGKMMKSAKISDYATLELKSKAPLKLSFNLLEGGQISYLLAPLTR